MKRQTCGLAAKRAEWMLKSVGKEGELKKNRIGSL